MDTERSAVINIGGVDYELVLTTRATKEIARSLWRSGEPWR